MVSTTAQSLFNSQIGDSQAEPSPINLAIYHSLNIPAFVLISASIAGFYLRYARRMSRPEKVGFVGILTLLLLSAPAALIIALAAGTFPAAVESIHDKVLPLAIVTLFAGSALSGVAARKVNAAPFGAAFLIAVGPVAIVSLSLGGVRGMLLVGAKILLGAGWLWFGSSLRS